MGVTRPLDITADQRKTLLALLKRHLPNTTAWAYGSRVKWTTRPQSDLDLVVFTTPDQDRRVSELREALEESNLPFRVDLFVWDAVPEQFRKQIKMDHVVLVEAMNRPTSRSSFMAREWTRVAVSNVANLVIGGTPSREVAEYWDGDIPWATAKDVTTVPSRYLENVKEFITEQGLKSSAAKLMPAGTVIITARGTVGALAQLHREMTFNQTCYAILPKDGFDANFLFYALKGTLSEMQSLTYGTIFETITRHTFDSWIIPSPPLPEQRAIAHILGTLDDKIELNRRMNETLETMARALFKSWFIDFDPVRAKAALRITPPLRGSRQGKDEVRSRAGGGMSQWGEIQRQYTQQTLQNAQTLRENRTDAEGLLWHYLRDKQLDGYKFRRQQPIGPYIVDFACMPQKLLIELDGGQHAEQHTYDQKRDAFLRAKGYTILRFWNNEVFENCFGVLENIYAALRITPPLRGSRRTKGASPQMSRWGDGEPEEHPPPHQPSPVGSSSATPPQGGSDWTVERARAYLESMDKEIAALFPDRLVDSELGPIPEGWEVSTIGQEVDVVGGSTPSTKDPAFWNGTINWATPKDLSSLESPVLVKTSRKITEKGLDNIGSGLLPGGTVLLSSRAPIGYLAISDVPVAINQGFIAMKCQKRLSNTYVWLWTAANMAAILENANGSTFQEISKSNFRPLRVIVPHVSVRKTYDKLVQQLYDRIVTNERQSRTLTALRDTLLPKLISGELRVNRQGVSDR